MSEFVKELNFDCDTFSGMKRDMNFVLQAKERAVSVAEESCGCG